MKKPPSLRARRIVYSIIVLVYSALIVWTALASDLILAALFLVIAVIQLWEPIRDMTLGQKAPHRTDAEAGVQ